MDSCLCFQVFYSIHNRRAFGSTSHCLFGTLKRTTLIPANGNGVFGGRNAMEGGGGVRMICSREVNYGVFRNTDEVRTVVKVRFV